MLNSIMFVLKYHLLCWYVTNVPLFDVLISEWVVHEEISSLQVSITVPVCVICKSQNFDICDLRSGQSRDLHITSLWENHEMCPASSQRVKTAQFFQDYDRLYVL